jgi:hypothetical protein
MEIFFSNNTFWLILLLLWTLPWKGVALWKASKQNEPVWFIVLLVVNTVGVLEILYIFIFSKHIRRVKHVKNEVELPI